MILLVLIALAARVDAAPAPDPIEMALRYADAMTGAGDAARRAPALDEDEDEDDGDDGDSGDEGDDGDSGDEGDNGDLAERPGGWPIGEEPGRGGELARLAGSDGDGDREELGDGDDTELARVVADDGAPGDAALGAGSGALAMLDAELDPGDAMAGLDAIDAASTAGAQEVYEQWMRHRRPSPWGRLDVGVAWRRRLSEPVSAAPSSHDELWLVATWRR